MKRTETLHSFWNKKQKINEIVEVCENPSISALPLALPGPSGSSDHFHSVETSESEQSSPFDPSLKEERTSVPTIGQSCDLDLGLYLSKNIDDKMKEQLLKSAWVPTASYKFPRKGGRNLSFQRNWLDKYSWLAYSENAEGALCKMCVLFGKHCVGKGGHQPVGALVAEGFKRYKNAIEKFCAHEKTEYHMKCVAFAENFLKVADGKLINIVNQIDQNRALQAAENRNKMKSIVSTVIFCGRQEIALRGKVDSGNVLLQDPDNNDGNFRSLLRLRVEAGDSALRVHLENSSSVAKYTSPRIQNELLDLCGEIIKKEIVRKVNNAKCFAVLADETTDVAKIEQMSLCLRYIDEETFKVKEDFLQFVPVADLTGRGLANAIIDCLKSNGVALEFMVGQGYDGAAAMSSNVRGVQTFVREACPLALYVHCAAHVLNLVLSHSSKIAAIRNCLGTVQSIEAFFSLSPKRTAVIKDCILVDLPETRRKSLLSVCETRWVYKHDAVIRFKELFLPIVHSLEKLADSPYRETSSSAHQLLQSVIAGQFIVALVITEKVFSCTLQLSKALQRVECDLAETCAHIDDVLTIISGWRLNANNEFNDLFKTATDLALSVGSSIAMPRRVGRQIHRDNVEAPDPEEYYRRSVFIPFLDQIILDLKERFKNHSSLLSNIQKVIPRRCLDTSVTDSDLKFCVEFYGELLPNPGGFSSEFGLWKCRWSKVSKNERPSTAVEGLAQCSATFYPNIRKLLQILATLPVSTATAERSFSSLKRLKNYLRNTMGQDRLTSLALLSVHRDINVEPEEVVSMFAKKARREPFLL